MIKNPYQAYQQNTTATASPEELTLMLYDGCLKFLGRAKTAMEESNIQEKNLNIQKAQNIMNEFRITLNMDIPVSKNLMALYEYMNGQLLQANMKNDAAPISEVEELLKDLRDTWKQAMQLNRQQRHGTGGQA